MTHRERKESKLLQLENQKRKKRRMRENLVEQAAAAEQPEAEEPDDTGDSSSSFQENTDIFSEIPAGKFHTRVIIKITFVQWLGIIIGT